MNVVIDTNVYLSHFRFGGTPSRVCLYCLEEADVFISPFIIAEVTRLLRDKFGLHPNQIAIVEQTFQESANLVIPTNPLPSLCRDLDDNNILQIAEFVQADFIITGDKDLLVLQAYGSCRIVTPTVFVEIMGIL